MSATSPKPFTFDEIFEFAEGSNVARNGGSRPKYSDEELCSEREASFRQGHENGLTEAHQQIESRQADALAAIGTELQNFASQQTIVFERAKSEAAHLALEIAAALAPALMRRQPIAEVTELISDCLTRMPMEPRIVIRLDEALVDGLSEQIDDVVKQSGFSGAVVLLGEPALTGSDCRVEWADGGAERDLAALIDTVRVQIERYADGAKERAARLERGGDETHPTSADDGDGVSLAPSTASLPEPQSAEQAVDLN